jgi:DnaJ-class molecular chaperone
MFLGKNIFEHLYPIKHFAHPQEQGKDSNRSEEKYLHHAKTCNGKATATTKQMRGFFASLRMTARTCNSKGKNTGKRVLGTAGYG